MANPIIRKEPLATQGYHDTMAAIPTAQFAEKIRGIPAEEIERISLKIAENISNHIGCVAKARITEILMQKKKSLTGLDRMLVTMLNTDAEAAVRSGKAKLFSEEESIKFRDKLRYPLKKAIAGAFSTPLNFLKEGIKFKLSDRAPGQILVSAAQEIGLTISQRDVPACYTLELKWNELQSQMSKSPVFTLVEKSNGVEFFREDFPLEKRSKL